MRPATREMALTDDAKITIKENGPYVVTGSVPLRRKDPVNSEHDEPLTWRTHPVLDEGPAFALCRCGGSSNKPYCDGTHASNGFDGTETAATDEYEDRSADLGGTGITITDDRTVCAHMGFCGNKVTDIWKMAAETGDSRVRAQAIAMVERCPSGALRYAIDGGQIEPDLPTEISAITDGPLWVSGGVTVDRSDGEPLEVRHRMTLCRCGQSKNKPLCDGSHYDAGFTG